MFRNEEPFEPALDRAVMDSLAKHPLPPAALEERVIHGLRRQRLLRAPAPVMFLRRMRFSAPWTAAAAAAMISFVVGVQVGRSGAEERPYQLAAAAGGASSDPITVSKIVSQAALDYVGALRLVQSGDSLGAQVAALGLLAAIDQIARIAPEYEVVRALHLGPPEPVLLSSASRDLMLSQPQLIWY
jgi:hypothetical protein